jgi:hypothetical protein
MLASAIAHDEKVGREQAFSDFTARRVFPS